MCIPEMAVYDCLSTYHVRSSELAQCFYKKNNKDERSIRNKKCHLILYLLSSLYSIMQLKLVKTDSVDNVTIFVR